MSNADLVESLLETVKENPRLAAFIVENRIDSFREMAKKADELERQTLELFRRDPE
jgi:hypothetical protein